METGIFTAKSKTGIFTAKSNKSNKEVKKGLRSKTFFDCEPELRFDFAVHFSS
jgi:hypothetical protein